MRSLVQALLCGGAISMGALLGTSTPSEERAKLAAEETGRVTSAANRATVAWMGPTSRITTAEFVRADSAESWKALWSRHMGDRLERDLTGAPIVPDVDFEHFMVIGVFRGQDQNNNGEACVSWDDSGDAAVLRYDPRRFQSETTGAEDLKALQGSPFGLFVVPRTAKPVVLEENVQQYIGFEPKWEAKHRFEAKK